MDVELSDSRLVEGSVVLAHNVGGKLMSVGVLTRAELQEFVQQAHDRYGVTADPFATPGSADVPATCGRTLHTMHGVLTCVLAPDHAEYHTDADGLPFGPWRVRPSAVSV